jgi:hypothetical protein
VAEQRTALLLAIPLTLDEFVASIERRSDYTRRYASDPGAAWNGPSGYREAVARPLVMLAEDARKAGICLFDKARLSDLAEATSRCSIVIVVGHWKGAEIATSDLLVRDVGELSRRVSMSRGDPRLTRLARKLESMRGGADRIADLLNAFILHTAKRLMREARRRRDGIRIEVPLVTAVAHARLMLDEILSDALRPGERLELADGLYDAEAVDAAIAPGFAGVLDVTTCTSVLLSARLEQTRKDAFRVVQFKDALRPDVAALTLRRTFQTMQGGAPMEYLRARARAINDVAEVLAAETKKALRRER